MCWNAFLHLFVDCPPGCAQTFAMVLFRWGGGASKCNNLHVNKLHGCITGFHSLSSRLLTLTNNGTNRTSHSFSFWGKWFSLDRIPRPRPKQDQPGVSTYLWQKPAPMSPLWRQGPLGSPCFESWVTPGIPTSICLTRPMAHWLLSGQKACDSCRWSHGCLCPKPGNATSVLCIQQIQTDVLWVWRLLWCQCDSGFLSWWAEFMEV